MLTVSNKLGISKNLKKIFNQSIEKKKLKKD